MLGAIIGDIIGSVYEWHNIKKTDFVLFDKECTPTDDSVMSIAVADGLIRAWGKSQEEMKESVIKSMQHYGRKYPNAGYGGTFRGWILMEEPMPYNSWGNGSAMRVSSVAWLYHDLHQVENMAKLTAEVTHNHPEGIKGAQAIAGATFLAREHKSKEEIKSYVEENYQYDLDTTLDEIRTTYEFNESCQGSVPQAIRAFLEGESYEDAVRKAISIGGDSDTIACMTGAIAEAFFGIPEDIKKEGLSYMDSYLKRKLTAYYQFLEANKRGNL
ncbi:MAG: ADP-ribosylglycohydrolase family protein [Eubacterium sp.]|nr:ADP-ribosylglycohydrolase family protein [Eubacterium sp.]